MKTIINEMVANAGDKVQQLAVAVNGQKLFKEIEANVRKEATQEVEAYLQHNSDNYSRAYKGKLPWKNVELTVKHSITYTWDNYRAPQKSDDKKTAAEIELERKVDAALNLRLFRKQLLESAQDAANMANASLRAARNNFKASEEALAALLPGSKCIHDDIQIAIG